jgi:hypothetical protein
MLSYLSGFLDFGTKLFDALHQFGFVQTVVLIAFACLVMLVVVAVRSNHTDADPEQTSPVLGTLGLLILANVAVVVLALNEPRTRDSAPSSKGDLRSFALEMATCASGRCGEGGPAVDPHINFEKLRPEDIVEATRAESTANKSFICTVYKTRERATSNLIKIVILMQSEGACQRYFESQVTSVQLQIETPSSHGRLDVNGRRFLYIPASGFRGNDRFVLQQCEIGQDLSRERCVSLEYSVSIAK